MVVPSPGGLDMRNDLLEPTHTGETFPAWAGGRPPRQAGPARSADSRAAAVKMPRVMSAVASRARAS